MHRDNIYDVFIAGFLVFFLFSIFPWIHTSGHKGQPIFFTLLPGEIYVRGLLVEEIEASVQFGLNWTYNQQSSM